VKFQGVSQLDVAGLDAATKPLVGTDYQQSFVSDFARLNLGPIYAQQGFLRVEFGTPVAKLIKDDPLQHSVTITIPVREGLQYRLAGLQFTGNSVISSTDLMKNIHLLPGKPANGVQLQLDLGNIHDLYGTRGYLTARVMPHPSFTDDQKTVIYDLQVHEGDLYRMGKFEIVGLDPAHAEAFKMKCKLAEGDPYDTSYWKTFLAQAGPYLPRVAGRWNVTFNQSPNSVTKTVDVTIGYKLTPSTDH
jgi:outer membrane translocation and assembly module TamA